MHREAFFGAASKGQDTCWGRGRHSGAVPAWKWPHHTCWAGASFMSLSLQPQTLAKHPPDSVPERPLASVVATVGGALLSPAWYPPTAPASDDMWARAGGRKTSAALQEAWRGPVVPRGRVAQAGWEEAASRGKARAEAPPGHQGAWCCPLLCPGVGKGPHAASFLGTWTRLGKVKSQCGSQDLPSGSEPCPPPAWAACTAGEKRCMPHFRRLSSRHPGQQGRIISPEGPPSPSSLSLLPWSPSPAARVLTRPTLCMEGQALTSSLLWPLAGVHVPSVVQGQWDTGFPGRHLEPHSHNSEVQPNVKYREHRGPEPFPPERALPASSLPNSWDPLEI